MTLKSLTTFAYKLTTISDYEICRTKHYATNFYDANCYENAGFFGKLLNLFLSKQLLKKGLFRDLVPLFRKLLWIRCMIGFGFFTLIFFCMFNTMGVTAEKKNPSNITPSSIYLCISFCEVIIIPKSNNIYIFDKKKSRFLFLTNMYFKLTSLSTKIAYILRQRTNSKRFLQNSPITFLSSVVWKKKKVNENQIEKKTQISYRIVKCQSVFGYSMSLH